MVSLRVCEIRQPLVLHLFQRAEQGADSVVKLVPNEELLLVFELRDFLQLFSYLTLQTKTRNVRIDTNEQLRCIERLCYIVNGAKIKPFNYPFRFCERR